jgi:hypothetical protein
MRVLGETDLARIITELEGKRVVQLFAADLSQSGSPQSQQQFLREIFAPHLLPGEPLERHENDAESQLRPSIPLDDKDTNRATSSPSLQDSQKHDQTNVKAWDLGFGSYQKPKMPQSSNLKPLS